MTLELHSLKPSDADFSAIQRTWDDLIAADPHSGFMQSSHWAAFKRRQGFQSTQMIVGDGAHLLGGAIGYAAREEGRDGWLHMPHGPVLPWQDPELSRRCLQLLVEKSRELSPDYNVMGMRIQPGLPLPVPASLRAFRRAPFDLLPDQTICLNLEKDEQQLLESMHPKCRYNIRLATKRGVRVREEVSQTALRSFYKIMLEAGDRDDFFVEPLSFFQDLLDVLPEGMVRLFLVEHEDDVLATILMIQFGGRATYLYGGTSNQKRNLMAGYAVQWQAIQAARAAGCSTYDFYGYVPPGYLDHPYARFSKFKLQFGGQPERSIGAMDLTFTDRLTDAVIRAIWEVQTDQQVRQACAAGQGGSNDHGG